MLETTSNPRIKCNATVVTGNVFLLVSVVHASLPNYVESIFKCS